MYLQKSGLGLGLLKLDSKGYISNKICSNFQKESFGFLSLL